ncbi:MAG: putative lipid II flippase FtsW [Actinomycetales bacterium mxb001]|nr:MAG: putative lipid II flippase FtsW [Actinomycetales bacterium mxb001]
MDRVTRHPMVLYYLLLGAALALLLLGLLMVLSSSSVLSIRQFGSPYTLAQRQGLFAVIGVVLMLVATRIPIGWWRRLAWPALILAFGLLFAVLIVGVEVSGQRNWIDIVGPFRLQPSEFAKLAIILWSADLLTRKQATINRWSHLLIPLLPVTALMLLLVLMEGDVGNTLLLALIVGGVLFAAGAPLRLFAVLGGLGILAIAALTLAAPYRMSRFTSWLDPSADRLGDGWQVTQGQYALGTGGWWGVGLGASREKWGSLPEAHTDFIFPVIGEELGLIGTLTVLMLFGVVAFVAFRIVQSATDTFMRLAAAGIGTWIIVQAVVNIGAVLSLLPITGVPLPLVSYGGSSLIPLLIAIGILLSFARALGGPRDAALEAVDTEDSVPARTPTRRKGAGRTPQGVA